MLDLRAVKNALTQHQIELPSWAFGNSGTRFKVFGQPGVPRTPYEKADDAAQVHKYTGVAPSMAVHIPWDKVDALKAAQLAGDVLAANAALMDAYNTDVRPLLAELRAEMGLAPDPVAAYRASGYGEEISSERKAGSPAGWGA